MENRKTTVLALIGSPRKGGNTDIMADRVLGGAALAGADTSKIYLDDHRVRPIGEVGDDSSARGDTRKDDDFPALLERFLSADVIVWASPVYWQGVTAQLKCFIDRMSCYFNRPGFRERFRDKGHVVLTAFGRKELEHGDWVVAPMKVGIELIRGSFLGEVRASVYRKGAVLDMPDVLSACRDLGAKAVQATRQEERR